MEPKGRGRHRSVEAQQAILKAALHLLEHKPLRKVTADAIAQKAGVSKATIYKWWPNKSLVALDAFLAGMTERVPLPDTGCAEQDFIQQLHQWWRSTDRRSGVCLASLWLKDRVILSF